MCFWQSCFSHLAAKGTGLTAHRKSPSSNQLWEVSQPSWGKDFARSSDTFFKNSVTCQERTSYQRGWLRILIDAAQSFSCPLVNLEQYDHRGFGQVHRSMTSQPCFLTAVIMTILAVVGDTRSNPTPQTWSALTKPSVTTIFSSFERIYRANRKNHCQSWIHCKNSCTRWQQNDNSSGSQHWQVTMEQHSSKRLGSPRNLCQGRQEDEDSNPAFFPPLYTLWFIHTDNCPDLPAQNTPPLYPFPFPIKHWFFSEQTLFSTDLLSSIFITQKYLKISGAASRQ